MTSALVPKDEGNAEQNPNPAEHPGNSVNGWQNGVWRAKPTDQGND
jgi:hypothetical protein